MHPAPSGIVFTVLSGLGFGFLAYLGLGFVQPQGVQAFLIWGLGYGLAVVGLVASTFHLGNPQRALLAFTQWRTSWLSREAWSSVAALLMLAPMALSDWLGLDLPRGIGVVGAVLCVATVASTSMIYAQIKAVPRWNHWTVPVLFMGFAATGGAILAMQPGLAASFGLVLVVVLIFGFLLGDGLFAARGATLGTATGLGSIGVPEVFELPHTGGNYLLREMVYLVARKHSRKLRIIAVGAVALAVLVMLLPCGVIGMVVALGFYLIGAFAARWLFFAEAEHVVGLYYGKR